MSDFSVQNSQRVNNTSAQVVYDAGETLKRAVQSVATNGTNESIEAMKSEIGATLKQHGVKNTAFVGQLLYFFRGVQQGVPGDLKKFTQAVQSARTAGALGPKGAASLLGMVGEAAQKQRGQDVANSMLNVKNQPQAPKSKPFGSVFDNGLLKPPMDLIGDKLFQNAPRKPQAQQAPVQAQQPKPAKKADAEVSPALERTITSLDITTKSMPEGPLKAGLEAVHSALELVKEAKSSGDKEAQVRAIANLTSKTSAFGAEIVKTFGQDPKLASLAASQLGKIASVISDKVVGPLKVFDNLSRVFAGKTLGGSPVDKNQRADAVYDLISSAMPGPVQAAMAISKLELEALYNYIGVPVHRAIEETGLKRLFGGKTPDQMKALIQNLPTDPANANATVRKLLTIFPETTAFAGSNPDANARALWRKHMSEAMKMDSRELRAMVNQDPKKPDAVPEWSREVIADRMKTAALNFVDQQVADAKGNW